MTPALSALVLPDRHPVSTFLADVREAERAGVRAVWTYDHLTWPLLADAPWYGAVPLLAAAAMCTERVRLGTQVASPNFRHPVPFAKELMTLDQLTGGAAGDRGGRWNGGTGRSGAGRAAARLPFTVAATGPRALRLAPGTARAGSPTDPTSPRWIRKTGSPPSPSSPGG